MRSMPRGFDASAPKRAVNMTLNEDLVRRARQHTANLSETVEGLLAAFVTDADDRDLELQKRIDAHIAASDAFIARHGSLADEFGTL
jgi:antitoxin CcdA